MNPTKNTTQGFIILVIILIAGMIYLSGMTLPEFISVLLEIVNTIKGF